MYLEARTIFIIIVTCGPMEGIQKAGRWRFLLSVAVLLTLLKSDSFLKASTRFVTMFFSVASNLALASSSSLFVESLNSCFSASSCSSYFFSFLLYSFFLSRMKVMMASLSKIHPWGVTTGLVVGWRVREQQSKAFMASFPSRIFSLPYFDAFLSLARSPALRKEIIYKSKPTQTYLDLVNTLEVYQPVDRVVGGIQSMPCPTHCEKDLYIWNKCHTFYNFTHTRDSRVQINWNIWVFAYTHCFVFDLVYMVDSSSENESYIGTTACFIDCHFQKQDSTAAVLIIRLINYLPKQVNQWITIKSKAPILVDDMLDLVQTLKKETF